MKARPEFGLLAGLWLAMLAHGVRAEAAGPPPLPDRNPMRAAPAKPLLPGEAKTIPWSEAEITAAKAECRQLLEGVAIEYEELAPIKEGLCGAPAPILVSALGRDPKVTIEPPATTSCKLASALHAWVGEAVQPHAKAELGETVVKLRNATSYACRNRYGGEATPLSEHALANALDISAFVLGSGTSVTVLASWPVAAPAPPLPSPNPERKHDEPGAQSASVSHDADQRTTEVVKVRATKSAPAEPSAGGAPAMEARTKFVRALHEEACKSFGTVLGPAANEAHRDHFHFDMKQRRKGFCE